MILEWLTYCLLVSTLLGLAALVAERSLRVQGWPARWVWATALLGSLGLPLATWLWPSSPEPMASALPHLPGALVMESLPAFSMAPAESAGPSLETIVLVAWAAASTLLLLWLMAAALRVWSMGRRFRRERVDGVDVLVSPSTGPAAMGVLRGAVVVPAWALELDARMRRLLLMHEAEHVRARDPGLAFGGLVAAALMPWNVPLWWQLARLRLAIEVDCDARVLARSGDARGYGTLLLEVGQRRARFAVGLAESKSSLERRIRMITERTKGRRTVRALALAALSGVVLAVACETPGPTELGPGPEPASILEQADRAGTLTLREQPVASCEPAWFVDGVEQPADAVRPDGENIDSIEVIKGAAAGEHECGVVWLTTKGLSPEAADRVRRVREEMFATPHLLRKTTVPQELFRQEGDRVMPRVEELRAAMNDASCPLGLVADGVILSDPSQLEPLSGRIRRAEVVVVPQTVSGRRFCRVIRISTTGAPDGADLLVERPVDGETRGRVDRVKVIQEAQEQDISQEPVFTPMTVKPRLVNEDEVRSLLETEYPPLLRQAGIAGVANVWFYIDADGRVRNVRLNETSGHDALDQAALRVARDMEFTPAYNRDRRVPVWIALDIAFESEAQRESRLTEARRARMEALESRAPARSPRTDAAAAPERSIQAAPVFTPMTVKPKLRNEREVQVQLMDNYPPLLRDAGIGGTVNVWIFLDETGRVLNTRLNETSGHDAFDQAALRVAETMEFTPALNRDTPVAVWFALDIKFEAQ